MHFYQRATIFRLSEGIYRFFRGKQHPEGKRNISSVVAQVVLAPRLSLLQISEEPECGMAKISIKQYQLSSTLLSDISCPFQM